MTCCFLGCVSDSFPEGLPCDGPEQECPPDQTCFTVGDESLCYASEPDPPDAAPPVIDAPPAIDATVSFDAFDGPCDPIGQNCGVDKACYWEPTGPICDTAGTGIFRQECVANTDCRAGLGCFPGAMMQMQCLPYCDTNNGMPCMGLDVCMMLEVPVGFCIFGGCDPLTQNCMATEGCYIEEMMMNETRCFPEGTAVHGESCTTSSDCEAGTHCLSCGAFSECATYCDTNNAGAECTVHGDGSTCQAIDGDVGACGPCS
jgi:hypothetical protein